LLIIIGLVAVGLAASQAAAKERVEATLESALPLNASAGEQLTIRWRLEGIDEGKRRPFQASGVFVRLLSATGGTATTAFAQGDGGATGQYEANIGVPGGGIGGIEIALRGFSSGPTGTSRSDALFPITNNPLPTTPRPPAPRNDATPAQPSNDALPASQSDSSTEWAVTVSIAVALILGIVLGGLVLRQDWRRRMRLRLPSADGIRRGRA
jgi:hypothetical protein